MRNREVKWLTGNEEQQSLIRLWALRLLVKGNLLNQLDGDAKFRFARHDSLLRLIGMDEAEEKELSHQALTAQLRQLWQKAERAPLPKTAKSNIDKNLQQLAATLSLTHVECEVLRFVIFSKTYATMEEVLDLAGNINTATATRLIAIALNLPEGKVGRAIEKSGTLSTSGLLHNDTEATGSIDYKFDLLDGLGDQIFNEFGDAMQLFQHLICKAQPSRLTMQDFDHITEKRDRLHGYLRQSSRSGDTGHNVLIYGEPGVGKTEMVRVLAQSAGVELFEANVVDQDGDPLSPAQRFRTLMLAQKLLPNRGNAMILFDEVEDVFPSGELVISTDRSGVVARKGWVNRTLETNPVTTVWVCNKIRPMDPAYLRRFDMVIEITPMSKRARQRMLNKMLSGLPVSQEWTSKMAHREHLHPGSIDKAKRVASMLLEGEDNSAQQTEELLTTLIDESQQAMGFPAAANQAAQQLTRYSLDYLNADTNLAELTAGLQECDSARVCLYGKPGTGKSAYAHYLAEQKDKALIVKKTSDLLDKYLGETEKNIARMFKQAAEDDAILLLDEGDSFLRDRTKARQSWEVTQVNELLTQMENFAGIFLLSTNLMDDLDTASLRRFDFKICFNYLKPEQSWQFFQQVADEQGITIGKESAQVERAVRNLHNLAPGDFAAILRKHRVLGGLKNCKQLLDSLVEECSLKPDGTKRNIGFV